MMLDSVSTVQLIEKSFTCFRVEFSSVYIVCRARVQGVGPGSGEVSSTLDI